MTHVYIGVKANSVERVATYLSKEIDATAPVLYPSVTRLDAFDWLLSAILKNGLPEKESCLKHVVCYS